MPTAPTLDWIEFQRSDASTVIEMVRAVAAGGDPGEYGDGVEVVIEAPRFGWFGRLIHDRVPDQARIVVTKRDGRVGYPFDVQLVSEHQGRAAQLLVPPPGWATSDSNGLAFVIQKRRPGGRYDWTDLVLGAIAALTALRPALPEVGWRAAVDRAISRG